MSLSLKQVSRLRRPRNMSGMPRNNQYSYLGNGVLRLFKDGDLDRHIINSISEIEVQQITLNLLQDLEATHAEGFSQQDLKPKVRQIIHIFLLALLQPQQNQSFYAVTAVCNHLAAKGRWY